MIPVAPYRGFQAVLSAWFVLLDQCSEGQGLNSRVDQLLRGSASAIPFARKTAAAWLTPGRVGVDPATVTEAGAEAARWLFNDPAFDLAAEQTTLTGLLQAVVTACDAVQDAWVRRVQHWCRRC